MDCVIRSKSHVIVEVLAGVMMMFALPVRQCRAQVILPPVETASPVTEKLNSDQPAVSERTDELSDSLPGGDATASNTTDIDKWHISLSPYLWFPGVHGTVGLVGRDLSVHATPGDLLSHFRFGLMGLLDVRRNRLVLPVDLVWVRLADDRAIPLEAGVTTANIKGREFILTPKVGVRLLGTEKFKIDALTGVRYWHLGESLNFNPSILGLNFSRSQNWVDPLLGGRIQVALSSKIVVNVAGDVGGWGTGSQLDYQVAGLLGYRIKPNWTVLAGYRYMGVDYRNGFLFNVIMPGALLGVKIDLR